MTGAGPVVDVSSDPAALADKVAGWLLALALATPDRFSLCLSGGSTPEGLYLRLAEPPYQGAFPWARTHLFWGDERFVPKDDARSNYRMAKAALLGHAPIPPENVHPVDTAAADPEAAAAAYQETLQAFYGAAALDPARPLFDVNLLGLGEDGHTASLFPGSPVLDERAAWTAAVVGAKAEARVTLTYPALESARHAVFLVEGAGKRAMLKRLIAGEAALPAARVRPMGELRVFCDAAARSPA
jgi:6-phosphogluconolactonase